MVDHNSSATWANYKVNASLCLTKSRGRSGGFWLAKQKRHMTITEMMKLQGIRPLAVEGWSAYLSDSAMGAALGNAMSVNVLERLVPRALKAAGLIHDFEDKWAVEGHAPFLQV